MNKLAVKLAFGLVGTAIEIASTHAAVTRARNKGFEEGVKLGAEQPVLAQEVNAYLCNKKKHF